MPAAVEYGIVDFVTGNAAVTAIIGTRVYPIALPPNVTLPALTYRRISGVRGYAHDGPSGPTRSRFQWDCWAATYSAAKNLAKALQRAVGGYRGAVGSGVNVVPIGGMFILNETDLREPDSTTFHVAVDVEVLHQEE